MSRTDHGASHGYDKGYGDTIDYYTPRSRVLATRKHRIAAIDEGLDEYRAENPSTPADEDRDPFWALVWEHDRLVIENFRLIEHLKKYRPRPDTGHVNHLHHAA